MSGQNSITTRIQNNSRVPGKNFARVLSVDSSIGRERKLSLMVKTEVGLFICELASIFPNDKVFLSHGRVHLALSGHTILKGNYGTRESRALSLADMHRSLSVATHRYPPWCDGTLCNDTLLAGCNTHHKLPMSISDTEFHPSIRPFDCLFLDRSVRFCISLLLHLLDLFWSEGIGFPSGWVITIFTTHEI